MEGEEKRSWWRWRRGSSRRGRSMRWKRRKGRRRRWMRGRRRRGRRRGWWREVVNIKSNNNLWSKP